MKPMTITRQTLLKNEKPNGFRHRKTNHHTTISQGDTAMIKIYRTEIYDHPVFGLTFKRIEYMAVAHKSVSGRQTYVFMAQTIEELAAEIMATAENPNLEFSKIDAWVVYLSEDIPQKLMNRADEVREMKTAQANS